MAIFLARRLSFAVTAAILAVNGGITNCVVAADPPIVTAPLTATSPSGGHADASLDSFRNELVDLKRKIDKPSKDFWDKVSALSGIVSGLLVAFIGFYATNVYNRRQKLSEERRKDQELLISQIQTIEKFMPHLSSKDENLKRGALIAISSLGNEELAIKLATAFGGPGATAALTTIASTAKPQSAASAGRALQDIFQYLQPRVVTISDLNGHLSGRGFIAAPHGLVVTASYVVDVTAGVATLEAPMGGSDIRTSVVLADGTRLYAKVIKIDPRRQLALLAVDSSERLLPLDLMSSEVKVGDRVICLLTGEHGELRIEIGNIVGTTVAGDSKVPKIVTSLKNVHRGSGGSPVLDDQGNLVGMIHSISSRKDDETVFLVSGQEILSFVEEITGDLATD